MSKFLRKKLHICFSSSSGVLSPSIPSSPIIESNQNPPSHHLHTPSIFINNFNSLYDHLSVSSPLHSPNNFSAPAAAVSNLLSGGVAITKHIESQDPYRDFGKSMREMVEARDLSSRDVVVAEDREYLQELLFCYLSLNPKHTHKLIVSAFADTLRWLLSPSQENPYFLSQSI
ncbi:unnamed protein product [Cochlearia groenlandica]